MTGPNWLIDEMVSISAADERQLARELSTSPETTRGSQQTPFLATMIQDIVIHDTKKWFGEADIRLDALVLHGGGEKDKPESFYYPQTVHFPRVADGDQLPIGEQGLLIFYGKPRHFLDITIMVSRDRKDSDDLAGLLSSQLRSAEFQTAFSTLLGLAVAAPQVTTVTAAVGAAAVIGNLAYQVMRQVTTNTIGLYRTSLLQYRDRFGIGRHPKEGSYRQKDLSFWYQIVMEKTRQKRTS